MIEPCTKKKLAFLLAAGLLALLIPTDGAEAKPRKKKEEEIRTPYSPSGEWEAFLKGEEGERYALLQPVEKNEDEHWLGLEFTDWAGPKFRMAVMTVDNKIAVGGTEVDYDDDDDEREARATAFRAAVPLGSLEGLVTSGFFNTHRFELIERQKIDKLMSELKFNSTELVAGPSASKLGRLLGAQYMLFAEVAEWNDAKNLMNTIGFAKKTAQVALTYRVLEVATGTIVYSKTFRGEAGSTGIALPFWGQQNNSPVHYALSICVNKAAYDFAMVLAKTIKDQPWSGAVAKVDGEIATLNAGSNRGLKPGMTLEVRSKGEEIIDPETGTSLGTDDEVIGSLQITSVSETYSKAVVIEGCKGLKVGDRVGMLEEGAGGSKP